MGRPFGPPTLHAEAEISDAIQHAYQNMVEDRAQYSIYGDLRVGLAAKPYVE